MTDTESSRTEVAAGATTQQEEESTAAKLRQQASDVASAGTQEMQHVASTAKQEAAAVVDDAGTQARRVVNEATTQLRRQGDEQVQRLAGTIGDLSQELRRMSDAGDGTAAGLASDAAEMLDRFGGQLMRGGFDGALNDLRRYARNRPGVFLAAAVGAGFVAGRLVRNVDRSALTGSQPDADRAWQPTPSSGLVTGPASTQYPSTQYPSSKPSPSATQAAAITPYPGPDERREPGSR
jgi:vacuolar-type H+-ATPase subunit H